MGGDRIMCKICGFTNCPPGCSNYEPRIIGRCDKCGEKLYEGYELWADYDGHRFCCEDCAKEYYEIKEVDY